MKLFLVTAIAMFLSPNVWACQDSGISFRIVSHHRIPPEGHANPLRVQEVNWRITNKTGCSIYVKGHQASKFYPIGVTLTYDPTVRKWESPFGGSRIPVYERLGMSELDQVEVKLNGSLEFTNQLGDAESSVKFRQVVYVSIGDSKSPPKAIVSPVFSFSDRLE